jgi:hypothetical protein
MVKRYLFKKWDNSKDYASCWYCNSKTLFYIFDKKTGEDFFCCSECALKKHKIKRLKKLMKTISTSQKKAILKTNPLIKKQKFSPSVPVQQTLEVGKQ